MEELNQNNLEKFFSDSMESFDMQPGMHVWSGVEARLEDEDSRLLIWWRRYGKYLIPLVLLFGIIGYGTWSQNRIETLSENINVLESKNQKNNPTKDEFKSEKVAAIVEKENSNSKSNNSAEATTSQISVAEANTTIPDIQTSNATIISTATNESEESDTNSKSIVETINNSNKKISTASTLAEPLTSVIRAEESFSINQHSEISSSTLESNKNNTALVDKPQESRLLLALPKINKNWNLDVPLRLVDGPIIIHQKESDSKYRIGLTGRFSNTFVANNDMFNGNESYGIIQDLKLTNSISLINSIHFNVHHYDIVENSSSIEPVIVKRYTLRSFEDNGGVQRIESNSEYIDFSIGLRYSFIRNSSNWKPYISSSFVSQMFLPQSFEFTDLQSERLSREDKRLVLYLGSGNLSFGIERQIQKNLYLQLGVWGESSFIPIGIQQEKTNSLGISISVLFGK